MERFRLARRGLISTAGMVTAALLGADPARPARAADDFDPAGFGFSLRKIAGGFDRPLALADPGDGSGRLLVVEQGGLVRILRGGKVAERPFLDMSGMISTGNNEQGLLGLALDPAFSRNGRLYVGYTASGSASAAGVGDNSVARIVVSPDDPDRAAIDTLEVLLAVEDPYGNHNGGQVAFGPDGYLYAGLGDGGAGGDPENHAQDPGSLLGSMLRLDVSGSAGYSIPGDNPFADGQGGRPEIWAYGLRNPWRFSFDRETGDLWIGDVGQNWIEEIDLLPAGSPGGANFGWRVMEGTSCYEDDECDPSSFVPPVAQYTHDEGCSVTGGYVYRGSDMPGLRGVYLFGDFCTGAVWGLGRDAAGSWVRSAPVETGLNISSFGEDADGNLYLLSFDGGVYRLGAAQ